jgi:polysaccharide biosynthesis/export protein
MTTRRREARARKRLPSRSREFRGGFSRKYPRDCRGHFGGQNLNRLFLRVFGVILAVLLAGLSSRAVAQEVRLGPGDVVTISVYGQKDLDTRVRISSDGKITFPLVGQVAIAGLVPVEAEAEIAQRLSEGNFVRNPQVNVFVEERVTTVSELVTILGMVKQPGRFPVESASNEGAGTVIGLIALAGGMLSDAADYLILTRRTGGKQQSLRVDLLDLLKSGDLTQNHDLMAGDIVFVPRMDVFYIFGEVHQPGSYRLERDMSVMQAISVGGGLTQYASEKDLAIKRRADDGRMMDIRVGMTDLLQPDDVLAVDASGFF